MTEFQKYILKNHPDPDGLVGNIDVFDQMCRLAESYRSESTLKIFNHHVIDKIRNSQTYSEVRRYLGEILK